VKALAVVVLALAAHAASVDKPKARQEERQLSALLPGLVDVITFNNDQCTGNSGDDGACKTRAECRDEKGIVDGKCAKGFGVCCLITGDITISGDNGGVFRSPKNVDAGIYTATLEPSEGVKQIKLEFVDFELEGPEEGDCSNDTFTVVGANPGTDIPVLCGNNDGQHMYINIDNSDGPYKLIVTTAGNEEVDQSWTIKAIYLSSAEAPQFCLQYHSEVSGEIMSFNHGDEDPVALNNHLYSICFGYVSGYCDTAITFSRFDLGNLNADCDDDYVKTGCISHCGDYKDYSASVNATGPMFMTVMTDDLNELDEEGFKGSYMMMKC